MATDFWTSSHNKRWLVDRATILRARALDRAYVDDPEYFDFLGIYFANAIMKLGRKLSLRQRVIATATVFFKRFYLKNAYCETDPFLVIAACCYVAAKAEECPVSIKVIASEARALFSHDNYNVKSTLFDQTRIAEMEFYLVDDLECDLTVFHPYRTLMALCKPDPSPSSGGAATTGSTGPETETEEGEAVEEDSPGVGVGADDGPRYWGTGEGQLELPEGGFQHAWFIINDTYRSNLCLLYPPHLVAIAAVYLTVVFHSPSRADIMPHLSSSRPTTSTSSVSTTSTPSTRRSTRLTQSSSFNTSTTPPTITKTSPSESILTFLSSMNVSLPLIATIMQEIISLWTLWDRYKEDAADAGSFAFTPGSGVNGGGGNGKTSSTIPVKFKSHRTSKASLAPTSIISTSRGLNHAAPPVEDVVAVVPPSENKEDGVGEDAFVTPATLSGLLVKMREARMAALVQAGLLHSDGAGTMNVVKATNKVLERAQAAG